MSNFKVPLVWQMYGCLDVEAETIQEAIEINPCNEMPLGADQNQMDESDKDTEGRYFMEEKANG